MKKAVVEKIDDGYEIYIYQDKVRIEVIKVDKLFINVLME